jgi:hypothetical protein
MPNFVISYLGGDHPKTPEEGQQHMADYQHWLGALGDAVISPANPFKDTHVVTPDGAVSKGSQTHMSGYTMVKADTIEEAIKMAQDCPFLKINGTLEVSEQVQMSMGK